MPSTAITVASMPGWSLLWNSSVWSPAQVLTALR